MTGVEPDATAREMESGMATRETVIPDFQLWARVETNEFIGE
jgi:hypothetical protein